MNFIFSEYLIRGGAPDLTRGALCVHDPVHMTSMTYTAVRETLAATMDRVCRDREPLLITRNRDQAVVMLSLEEYQMLEETAHLLGAPANARRLRTALAELGEGKGKGKSPESLPAPGQA